ncbi:MAG: methyltransferase domain-containing protein [Streptosporangiaceae bacterium]
MTSTNDPVLLVGQLAAQTGLTVRTLHYYDQLGLLRPSARTPAGYRCYSAADVERLYRIRALRALGLPLGEIAAVSADDFRGAGLAGVVGGQLAQIRQQQAALAALENQLSMLRDALASSGGPNPSQLLMLIGRMTMAEQAVRYDYSDQADHYDRTRGVSSAVLGAVTTALADAPGRALLDIGGGTGNYAMALREQGWAPLLIDTSPQMRQVAQGKGLPAIPGEAASLPFGDTTFDAVTMINMLHQVGNWQQALAEAHRVLRPDGCLAIMLLTADHIREVSWVYDLFPAMREFALPHAPSLAQLRRELPGARVIPFWFDDLSDASIAALCAFPEAMLDPELRRQNSFFGRLEREHPRQLEAGLTTLRSWLGSGRRPEQERADARNRLGDSCVIASQATPKTLQ